MHGRVAADVADGYRYRDRKTFIDGSDALTWSDLHTAKTEPLPTVNWRHIENGKMTWIWVTFTRPPTSSGWLPVAEIPRAAAMARSWAGATLRQ